LRPLRLPDLRCAVIPALITIEDTLGGVPGWWCDSGLAVERRQEKETMNSNGFSADLTYNCAFVLDFDLRKVEMRRPWLLRLVSVISLLAFFIANEPISVAARILTPACHSEANQAEACEGCCKSCRHDSTQNHQGRHAQVPSLTKRSCGNPLCPLCHESDDCPLCPCPGGCTYCSVAKAPCSSSSPDLSLAPAFEEFVAETTYLLPPAHDGKLIRPPRA
jgi:hypothetical protein